MNQHCCADMNTHLSNGEVHVYYNKVRRFYAIDYKKEYGSGSVQLINFCPWCGKQLPENLTDVLSQIVFDELELDGFDDPKLPSEFQTDEWWKKRGL